MAIRKILTLPDNRLKLKSEPIITINQEIQQIAQDLIHTLNHHPGVGIAAPQIAELKRIILIDARRGKRPCKNHGQLIMLNPQIINSEGKITFREGCLSVPDYSAFIERKERIVVKFIGLEGKEYLITASGFEAVVIQHEIDHLDGILFIDRIKSSAELIFRK